MGMKEISLRPYQTEAVNGLRDSFKKGNRKVILMLPTGAGKTRIAASIIKSVIENGKKSLFICDRVVLIEQTLKAFEAFDIPCGVVQAQHEKHEPHQPLQICSIQTLKNRSTPHADLILVDEVHTVYKYQNELMAEWDNVRFVGLTATPFTKGLGKNWDDLVVGVRTQELIDLKYLSPFDIYGAPKINLKDVKKQAGDYNQKQLGEAVNKTIIVGNIIKNWTRRGEGRQTICFAVNIAHSKHIVEQFLSVGIKAEHIDCFTKTEEREQIYKDFTERKITILSSVDILSKGFDEPQVSCLIMSRPTKSLTVYIQQFGRVLRTYPGKKDAIVLDHGNNFDEHGSPTDQLPELLCMGVKSESKAKIKKEPEEKECGNKECRHRKPPKVHKCPKCGFEPEIQPNVISTDEILEKKNKTETSVKKMWFSMLLHYAREKKWQDGSASHMYKHKFGVWPHKKTGVHPTPPNEEVKKYIQHLNIKRAKARKANVNNR